MTSDDDWLVKKRSGKAQIYSFCLEDWGGLKWMTGLVDLVIPHLFPHYLHLHPNLMACSDSLKQSRYPCVCVCVWYK